jgi:hypothetical protein
MTYQTQLRPWCIVRQLPEMKRVIIDRFRHYPDAEARVRLLRQQMPNGTYTVLFEPDSPEPVPVAH